MSSRPKPQVLDDGRVVELDYFSCSSAWAGSIAGKATKPGHYSGDEYWMTMDTYPTVRALRAALMDGSARFETMAERSRRMGWDERVATAASNP